ncbi:hypothetical protein [Methanothrix soehngenii]|uniref:hypothetical protein n=1 Tax=Methanothrix soehngenii TaxID=2223 RepID=UPI00300CD440
MAAFLAAGTASLPAQNLPNVLIRNTGDGKVRLEWPGTGDLYQLQEAAQLSDGEARCGRMCPRFPYGSPGGTN